MRTWSLSDAHFISEPHPDGQTMADYPSTAMIRYESVQQNNTEQYRTYLHHTRLSTSTGTAVHARKPLVNTALRCPNTALSSVLLMQPQHPWC